MMNMRVLQDLGKRLLAAILIISTMLMSVPLGFAYTEGVHDSRIEENDGSQPIPDPIVKGKVKATDNKDSFNSYNESVSYSYYGISNRFLSLEITSASVMSSFRFHTVEGDPDNANDDNCRLLYNETSFTTIMINGEPVRFNGALTEIDNTGESATSIMNYSDIEITQIVTLTYNPYTQRKDLVEFKYVITNKGTDDKEVGTRIFFDIMLGNNDNAPFKVPGYGDITTETEFIGDKVPQVWQSFDDLYDPTVIASGTLYRNLSERPDKVHFVNYNKPASNDWDYVLNPGEALRDTAVSIYFNPAVLKAGETREVKTYYGLNAFKANEFNKIGISLFAPAMLMPEDDMLSYSSNPFTINGFVTNLTDEPLHNVSVALSLHDGLATENECEVYLGTIESGANVPVSWLITALPQYKETEALYYITLSADGIESEHGYYSIVLSRLYDDYGNAIGEPLGQLSAGTITDGRIEIVEDIDFFSFVPEETGFYSFESHSDMYLVGNVRDRYGYAIHENTRSGIGDNFYMEVYLEAGTQYYLAVYLYEGDQPGSYSLSVKHLTDNVGNDMTNATEAAVKTIIEDSITYCEDIDVYTFVAPANGWYTVESIAECSLYAHLVDEDGNEPDIVNRDHNILLASRLETGKRYYLFIVYTGDRDLDDARWGNYSLYISLDETPPVITGISPTVSGKVNGVRYVDVYASDNVSLEAVELYYSLDQIDWIKLGEQQYSHSTFIVDTAQLPDGVVYFRAVARDMGGLTSTDSPIIVYIIDNTPPEKVEIVSALSTIGAAYLAWEKSAALDAAGYSIYRSSDGGSTFELVKVLNDVNTLYYIDTSVSADNVYTYKIAAFDDLKQEGTKSDPRIIDCRRIDDTDTVIGRFVVSQDASELMVGGSAKLSAVIEYKDGTNKNVSDMMVCVSSDPDVLSVDNSGNILGLAAGTSTITVSVMNLSVNVVIAVRSLAAVISSHDIVGTSTQQITATYYTLDGIRDVTTDAEYTVAHEGIVTVSPDGLVTGVNPGSTYIIVSYNGQTVQIPVNVYAPAGKVESVNVENGAVGIVPGKVFTWIASSYTNSYQVYFWAYGSPRPSKPTAEWLTAPMYQPSLEYNKTYCWQIVSVNSYSRTESNVFTFTTQGLPDLVCNKIEIPDSVYSENPLTIRWSVKNIGNHSTGSIQWADRLYLSPTHVFDTSIATYIGSFTNFTALEPGESYDNEFSFTVPRGMAGTYYLFVISDCFSNVRELDEQNNYLVSSPIRIDLSPKPDLIIAGVELSPERLISGSQLTVSWQGRNTGEEITDAGSWYDRIWISNDEVLSADDILLATVDITVMKSASPSSSFFYYNGSYAAFKTVTIPQNIFGNYFIIVSSNDSRSVYENIYSNNTGHAPLEVILDPPADIEVKDVSVPGNMISGEEYTIAWTDVNSGSRDLSDVYWSDRVYLSQSSTFTEETAARLAIVTGVKVGVQNTATVRIPSDISGNYYIHIVADYGHSVYEYKTYENNIYTSPVSIELRATPDLSAVSIDAPTSIRIGEKAVISYVVQNAGTGSTIEGTWYDAIYLSKTDVIDHTSIKIAEVKHSGDISAGESYNGRAEVIIPSGLTGRCYIILEVNNRGVFENNATGNNTTVLETNVLPRLPADLTVVSGSAQRISGALLLVTYTVENHGEGTATAPWYDAIYLSKSSTGVQDGILLGLVYRQTSLEPGGSYTETKNCLISGNISGDYYIVVVTDYSNSVLEGNKDDNNILGISVISRDEYGNEVIGDKISIEMPKNDLQVYDLAAPGSAVAGKEIAVSWKVTNASEQATRVSSWSDEIYLVDENETDYTNGTLLGTAVHRGALSAQETYTASATVKLPFSASGKYRIVVVADGKGAVLESDRANNIASCPIEVEAAPEADLAITAVDLPEKLTTGQPVKISWTVSNSSDHPIGGTWYDAVYLSYTESTLDFKLAEIKITRSLEPGQSYTAAEELTLPSEISGPMYIVIKTNSQPARADIYEVNFDHNTKITAVELTEMDPVDLAVSAITMPLVAYPGSSVTISWDIVNLTDTPLNAVMTDVVYISADNVWDSDDVVLGELTHQVVFEGRGRSMMSLMVDIPDYDTLTRLSSSLTGSMPGVIVGDYYIIVRIDVKNQINDGNRANNRAASEGTLSAQIESIPVGGTISDTISRRENRYYRFYSNGGQSLRVDLDCLDDSAANEIYVGVNRMPTAVDYDYKFTGPMAADHTVVIPISRRGEYYIYIRNISLADEEAGFTLLVESISYGVNDVYPEKGANGKVTLKLSGALLEANIKARLVQGKVSIQAEEIYYFDSSNVYATFDLRYAPTGAYSLVADCNGSVATLGNCFEVINGSAGELQLSLDLPASYRVNTPGTATIRYKNTGNTDIPAPVIVLSADSMKFLQPGSEEYADGSFVFYAYNPTGPAGILPPGAEGAYNFVFCATATGDISFKLYTLSQLGELPNTVPSITSESSAVDIATSNVQALLGSTGESFTESLSHFASYYSQFGYYTNDPDDLVASLYLAAVGEYANTAIATMEDISLSSGGTELPFVRNYFTGLLDRWTDYGFGPGWSSTFDGQAIVDGDYLAIKYPYGTILYIKGQDGIYRCSSDRSVAVVSGSVVTVTKKDGSRFVYASNGQLAQITYADGNLIDITYENDKIKSIRYNNETLWFTYSGGKISTISNNKGQSVAYRYDDTYGLLTSVTTEKGTVFYEYDTSSIGAKRFTLTKITYLDGTYTVFSYDSLGRLVKKAALSGTSPTVYQYDAGMIATIDAMGNTTRTYYDHKGQIVLAINADGIATEYKYNEMGLLQSRINSLFALNSYTYDAQGNVTQYTDPLGYSVRYLHDDRGNITSVRDENGRETKYFYNSKNLLSRIVYYDGTFESYTYDSMNQLISYTGRNGDVISYSYDSVGRLSSKKYEDGSKITYTYDDNNRITGVTDDQGTISFEYDSSGNLLKLNYPNGKSISYTYDSFGRKSSMTYPEGQIVHYSYDNFGRLAKLTDADGSIYTTYTYNALGQVTKQVNGNGTYTVYRYMPSGNYRSVTNHAPDGTVNSYFEYSYDRMGNITSIRTKDGAYTYEYDLKGQLVSATDPYGNTTTYAYDPAGNRTEVKVSGVRTAYTTNSMNQYTAIGNRSYSYDAAGNLRTMNDGSGITTYTYDAEGRLVEVSSPLGLWEYGYNAMGERNSMTVNGVTTEYIIDSNSILGNVITSYKEGNVTTYTHGIKLVSMQNDDDKLFYDFDMYGSTTGLTDLTGKYVNTYSYSPTGQITSRQEIIENPFTYAGAWGVMDDSNGLYYVRARYYSPELGRFTAMDNYGQRVNTNGYTYSFNNYLAYVDFDGEVAPLVIVAAGLTGALVSGTSSYITNAATGKKGMDLAVSVVSDAIGGAVGGATSLIPGVNRFSSYLGAGTSAALQNAYDVYKGDKTVGKALTDTLGQTVTGGAIGTIAGNLANNIVPVNTGAISRIKYLKTILFGPAMGGFGLNLLLSGFAEAVGGTLGGLLFEYLQNRFSLDDISLEEWMRILGSLDPNEIIGPASYGDANWVSGSARLEYTILFENDPVFATAPVQFLTITQDLDNDLDIRTFRLGSFGFAGMIFDVPENTALYQARLDLTDTLGLYIDVLAGIDVVSGKAEWTFTAIDPATGRIPSDPTVGFLPVNNKETGDGEGFVTYTITPKKGVVSGEVINAMATIVFDNNAPIDTPEIFNTIDAGKPSSSLISAEAYNGGILLEWDAADGHNESGYAGAEIYVSIDEGLFRLAAVSADLNTAFIEAADSRKYGFIVRSYDHAENYEDIKASAELEVDTGFVKQKVQTPYLISVISPDDQESILAEIRTDTENASIFYTTDGTYPTTNATKYTGILTLTKGTVLKAIAVAPGMHDSDIFECVVGAEPEQVSPPVASPAEGEVAYGMQVELTTPTDGASIYYTTDGSTPTTSSTLYTGPITITAATTIKAIAVKSGMADSEVSTFRYTIAARKTYTVSYDAGEGIGAPPAQIKTHDEPLTISSAKPTRSGYEFLGWSASSSSNIVEYLPGDAYLDNQDVTLYAVWKKISQDDPGTEPEPGTDPGSGSGTPALGGDSKSDAGKTIIIDPETGAVTVHYKVEDETAVELSGEDLGSITQYQDLSVVIETSDGTIELSGDTLRAIIKAASGDDITIDIQQKSFGEIEDLFANHPDAERGSMRDALIIEVTIGSGSKKIRSFGGQSIVLSFPVEEKDTDLVAGDTVKVYSISDDGTIEELTGIVVEKDGVRYIEVRTTHLSYFVLTDERVSSFIDVDVNSWYYRTVNMAVYRGLFKGVSETEFAPDMPMTRAMVAETLYRLEGKPGVEFVNAFKDVSANAWYARSTSWAAINGMITGYSDHTFRPDVPVTREQLATILYRYAKHKRFNVSASNNLSAFSDSSDLSDWSLDAVKWAVAEGLINGVNASTLAPKAQASRSQVATILLRFIEKFMGK